MEHEFIQIRSTVSDCSTRTSRIYNTRCGDKARELLLYFLEQQAIHSISVSLIELRTCRLDYDKSALRLITRVRYDISLRKNESGISIGERTKTSVVGSLEKAIAAEQMRFILRSRLLRDRVQLKQMFSLTFYDSR